MNIIRRVALSILTLVLACALVGPLIAPHKYDQQFREVIDASPSASFPLGTDQLGRDRFSRLIYGTAISISLACAAAATSILIALVFAAASSVRSSTLHVGLSTLNTLTLSVPWIFPFIVLRSLLPLNTAPAISILLTFALIGIAGWAYPGRVFSSSLRDITSADWLLLARASGVAPWRVVRKQIFPHLKSVAVAQFRILIPAYILSEASLGLLGLGVAEPLPSWGNMLLELHSAERVGNNPVLLTPLALLMTVMICLELLGNSAPERTA